MGVRFCYCSNLSRRLNRPRFSGCAARPSSREYWEGKLPHSVFEKGTQIGKIVKPVGGFDLGTNKCKSLDISILMNILKQLAFGRLLPSNGLLEAYVVVKICQTKLLR